MSKKGKIEIRLERAYFERIHDWMRKEGLSACRDGVANVAKLVVLSVWERLAHRGILEDQIQVILLRHEVFAIRELLMCLPEEEFGQAHRWFLGQIDPYVVETEGLMYAYWQEQLSKTRTPIEVAAPLQLNTNTRTGFGTPEEEKQPNEKVKATEAISAQIRAIIARKKEQEEQTT